MDLLKITDDQEGFYLKNDNWAPIGDIEKDNLLYLIRTVANEDMIVLDEVSPDNRIKEALR